MSERKDPRPRSTSAALLEACDLRQYLEGYSLKQDRLPDDVRSRMQVLAGWLDPRGMALNLASALRVAWTAEASKELEDGDLVNCLWLLSDVADLLADVVFTRQELHDRLHYDELLRCRQA